MLIAHTNRSALVNPEIRNILIDIPDKYNWESYTNFNHRCGVALKAVTIRENSITVKSETKLILLFESSLQMSIQVSESTIIDFSTLQGRLKRIKGNLDLDLLD